MSDARIKSPLSTYERISPNKNSPRNKNIRRLTPHCVAGNLTLEAILGLSGFQKGGNASTTYAIDSEGKCGLGVEETNRPWTTSSSINDNEAITFEIANNGGAPDWRMSDKAINAWMDMAVEIASFYGFKKVNYKDKPSNITSSQVETWINTWAKKDEMIITLHRWYAAKACPGDYLVRQLPWLIGEINKRLQDSKHESEPFIGEGVGPIIITSDELKNGCKGEKVKELQTKLNERSPNLKLDVDGSFGPKTETAVKSFQASNGLSVDGVVGALTWAELNKDIIATTKPEIKEELFKEYLIGIKVSALNIRSGPGINNPVLRTLVNDKNTYTIIEESDGPGAKKWGKLKSGAGWVSLDFTVKK